MTPEHRRVAAFLLREEQEEAQRQRIRGGAGSWAPGSGAVAGRADVQAGPGGWRIWQALRRHGSRDLVARGALVKLMILLMALIASAPEFQESGQKARPDGASAVSERSRATPRVPERAAQESRPMKSFKRLVVSGCAAMPLAFVISAQAQQAVEWRVSEGGNGHWYGGVITNSNGATWSQARLIAQAQGADLAKVASSSHLAWLFDRIVSNPTLWSDAAGPWVGALQQAGSAEPADGWTWIDGTDIAAGVWSTGQPDDALVCGGDNNRMAFWNAYTGVPQPFLEDSPGEPANTPCVGVRRSAIIEWSADCNADGIVDYGQILSGELADTNGNGVPDCCEDGTACVSSLVANASFEAGSPLAACATESVSAPSMLGSAWQVSAGTVDRVRGGAACATSTQPKFGDFCVDLCGTPASSGAIRQIVATVPGHRYRCTFWLSGDASAGPATKKVHAKVGSYVDLSYTFACSGTGAQAWVPNQFEFTARGASETLEFVADNGATTGGPMLDAVNLADITTQCVGDVDGSGNVDGADIALLLLNFGDCPTSP